MPMDSTARNIPQFEWGLQNSSVVTGDRFRSFQNLPSNKIASNAMGTVILFDLYHCNIFDTSCGYKGFCLTDEVMAVAESSNSYSFVFDILLDALNHEKRISSFLKYVTKEQFGRLGLEELQRHVNVPENFMFEIQDLIFYGFYLKEYDGYILQTDLKK